MLLRQVENAAARSTAGEAGEAGSASNDQGSFAQVYASFAAARSGAGTWEAAARDMVRATAPDVLLTDADGCGYHDLDAAVDSFRTLYCRRCHVFDCHLHGCGQLLADGRRAAVSDDPATPTSPCGPGCVLSGSADDQGEQANWTPMEQSLFTTACKIHGRNSCRIARVISTRSCAEVRASMRAVACLCSLVDAQACCHPCPIPFRFPRGCAWATSVVNTPPVSMATRA
jgi:hypothetical protein